MGATLFDTLAASALGGWFDAEELQRQQELLRRGEMAASLIAADILGDASGSPAANVGDGEAEVSAEQLLKMQEQEQLSKLQAERQALLSHAQNTIAVEEEEEEEEELLTLLVEEALELLRDPEYEFSRLKEYIMMPLRLHERHNITVHHLNISSQVRNACATLCSAADFVAPTPVEPMPWNTVLANDV